jgi:DNA invertase Pin-like site-specific DNA recombinase
MGDEITMKVGYARVSREEQHLELQLDALNAAGCAQIFTEKIKSVKDQRPQLEQALQYVRPGDTLVVWRLDRLGRSLKNLLEIIGFLEERGIEFQSLTEHLETSNPSGKLIFHIFECG